MGMFSWNCVACGFSIRDCGRCTEQNWQSEAVVLTPGGSRIIGHYDGYGRIGGTDLSEQIDQFSVHHKACWDLAGKPEYDKPSPHARDQGFCLGCHDDPYYTLPIPTSPEWFTIARQWHAIERLFGAINKYLWDLSYAAHESWYRELSDEDRPKFEHSILGWRIEYDTRKPCPVLPMFGHEWNVRTAHLVVCCARRDRGDGWPPSPLQVMEEWVGDDEAADGCYVKAWELSNGEFEIEVIVDCDSAGFVDTLANLGNYPDLDVGMIEGRGVAVDWCMTNGVDFELNE